LIFEGSVGIVLDTLGLPMTSANHPILRGTLDLLVLKAVSGDAAHGYEIARWVERAAGNTLRIEDGSLYPALYRLEERGLISPQWRLTDDRRRAKFYSLTAAGRRRLRTETATWTRYAHAIFAVLETPVSPQPSGT
jgi:transcriptional regulator